MTEIIRTEEQIKALIEAMRKELDDPRIVYGREETYEYLDTLRATLRGETFDEWNEAGYWLVNERSTLGKDYGIE